MENKTKYNQEKINNFLDNDSLSLFIDNERNSFYILNENKFPVSFLGLSKSKNNPDLYSVEFSYSQAGLGKILYYVALMNITESGGKLSKSDKSVSDRAKCIWDFIDQDESIGYILKGNEKFYFKAPDNMYSSVLKNKGFEYNIENTDHANFKKKLKITAIKNFGELYESNIDLEEIKTISNQKTASYLYWFSNEELVLYENENNLFILDRNKMPLAGIGDLGEFGIGEYLDALKEIKNDKYELMSIFSANRNQERLIENSEYFNDIINDCWGLYEEEFLDKKIDIIMKNGIRPNISYTFFESEKNSSLDLSESLKTDNITRFYLKIIEKANEYYKNNPIEILNSSKELKLLMDSDTLNLYPDVNVVFYDNDLILDHFDLDCDCVGFFATTDGNGIRKNSSDSFLNKNIEIYIKLDSDFKNIVGNEIKNFGLLEDKIILGYGNTLTHELCHVKDFLSLSGGNSPESSYQLGEWGALKFSVEEMVFGKEAFKCRGDKDVDWLDIVEDRVELEGIKMYKKLKLEQELEYKEFLKILDKLKVSKNKLKREK